MTREHITTLNPHFYTTSSAPFEGTVTAIDGVNTNFLAKLTRDVDRDSATVDLIFLGLPSPALVKARKTTLLSSPLLSDRSWMVEVTYSFPISGVRPTRFLPDVLWYQPPRIQPRATLVSLSLRVSATKTQGDEGMAELDRAIISLLSLLISNVLQHHSGYIRIFGGVSAQVGV